jgi:hypothetical protein
LHLHLVAKAYEEKLEIKSSTTALNTPLIFMVHTCYDS